MDGSNPRKRSRSPYSNRDRDAGKHRHRDRSRSPDCDAPKHHKHRHHHHRHHHQREQPATSLPFQQRPLDKRDDFEFYEAVFAEYLDIQKQLRIEDLEKDEVKGRWKSFVGKWNRGELAEGWYDPEMKERVDGRFQGSRNDRGNRKAEVNRKDMEVAAPERQVATTLDRRDGDPVEGEAEDDDDFGPSLPTREPTRLGPSIPDLQDLQHRRELLDQDTALRRSDAFHERKADRAAQKTRLEELVPRADPGSHERKLEKRADKTSILRASREAKDGGDVEIPEADVMGGDEGFKAELKKRAKVKNEREIRKEEALRARAAEREERMKGVREKEEKTMQMLRDIARERFG